MSVQLAAQRQLATPDAPADALADHSPAGADDFSAGISQDEAAAVLREAVAACRKALREGEAVQARSQRDTSPQLLAEMCRRNARRDTFGR